MTDAPKTPGPLVPRYDDLVRRAQAECCAASGDVEPRELEAFWGHVARGDRQARRRTAVVQTGLGALAVVAVLNILVFPIWPGRTCPGNDRLDVAIILALPLAAILLSMGLVRSTSAGGQMLLRALLWSSALLGALVNVIEPGVVPVTAAVAGVVAGGALLILRQHGLEPERYTGAFAPVAHRGVLTLMMILAVADAQTLVAWTNGSYWYHPAAGICGLAMVVGIIGLSRLELWGLLLSALMSLGIAIAALSGWLELPFGVVAMISGTAGTQVVLAAVVLRSVRRGTPTELPILARWGSVLVWLVIAAVMVASVAGPLLAGPEHRHHHWDHVQRR
jgi:hypothetical protein